jgi:hypothetical protein
MRAIMLKINGSDGGGDVHDDDIFSMAANF